LAFNLAITSAITLAITSAIRVGDPPASAADLARPR
jgi:hypothetical protein